jgi:hypothetical protein
MSVTATKLHAYAMKEADEALYLLRRGDADGAAEAFASAAVFEANAARLAEEIEPTRSILYRSAASLALRAGNLAEAERLIFDGLKGNPPDDIAAELHELREQIHLEPQSSARSTA